MAGFAHRGVPDGSVGLWRLPQAGFVIRAGGRTAIVDPWLTESDAIERVAPPPVRAGELPAAALVCCTHEHADHLDLETLRALPGRPPVVVPAALADEVAAAGLEPVRVAVGQAGGGAGVGGLAGGRAGRGRGRGGAGHTGAARDPRGERRPLRGRAVCARVRAA